MAGADDHELRIRMLAANGHLGWRTPVLVWDSAL
jgi:hypothetical protein